MSADSAPHDGLDGLALKAFVNRLMAIHDKVDEKHLQVRAVYAQAAAAGYDKTSIGKIVHYLRLPAAKRAEVDAMPGQGIPLLMNSYATRLDGPLGALLKGLRP